MAVENDNLVTVEADEMPARELEEPEGFTLYSKDDKGRQVVFKPQEDYQCFAVRDWTKMGHLITDYHWLYSYAISMRLMIANMTAQIGRHELQTQLWKDMAAQAEESRLFTYNMYKEERSLKIRTEFINKATMWLAVGVALLEAGVIGIMAANR